jgi:Ca2+-binding RTX toxin-like protein
MAKITGTNNGERLDGTKADDEIYLLGGDDTCVADLGNDTVYGGDGNDTIYARYSGTYTIGDDGDDSFFGEAGNDTIYGGTGNDSLDGGTGNDKLYGEDGNDSLAGADGNDTLDGGDGNDTLNGGNGNDALDGRAGVDFMYGGDGDDTFYAGSGNDKVWGGAGNDIIWAIYTGEINDGDDAFYGEAGDDKLYGYAGNDTLDGGDGADYLSGGEGNDSLLGGIGNDSIYGGIGNDTLDGSEGVDYLSGGEGNDSLVGGTGNDDLYGGVGNDTLDGEDGDDYLDGGEGNDTINGGMGNDTLWGGIGNDFIDSGTGDNKLYGETGDDTVKGGDGADYLSGGDGNDSLLGGLGKDSIYGGIGNDTIDGGEGVDYLSGSDGNDSLSGGLGNDSIFGGTGNDILDGGDGVDYLSGGDGNDKYYGGAGDDTIYADAGDDTIEGGMGNDTLYGGSGIDVAIFSKSSSSYTVQIDGPCVFVIDKQTNEKDKLTGIEKLSFAGVVSDVSVYGSIPVDFNTLSILDKKTVLEDNYKALIYEGTLKWSGVNLTYSFAESEIYYYSGYLPTGEPYKFEVLGSYLKSLARETFEYLSSILALTFTETTNTQTASFKFASHNMTMGGYANPPTTTNAGTINIGSKYNNNQLGQYGVDTLIHELGHALGLDHTSPRGDATAGESGGDDVPSISDYLDRSTFSIMSYASVKIADSNLSSFSALDIRALFALYGKRESTDATTFKLHYDSSLSTSSKQSSLNNIQASQWDIYGYAPFMIVDNGGVDTIDVSDWKGGVKVDLSGWGIGPIEGVNQRYSFNSSTNGTLWSESEVGSPIVTIYPDTVIEKIIGSSENDILIGYTASETLLGGAGNDQITGGGGNDQINGGGGNDTINGGTGIDTAVYLGNISDYLISYNKALSTLTITDKRKLGDDIDNLKDVEKLQFSDKTFDLINPSFTSTPTYGKTPSFLFDPVYYLLKNPELVPTVNLLNSFDHYKTVGAAASKSPNNWFDPVYYSNKWADLKPLKLDAATLFIHYNLYGVWEGRSAGPTFDKYDGTRYLKENPDVAAYVDAYVADFLGSRVNGAIAHYIIYGANESRMGYDLNGQVIDPVILIGTPLS